jgi:scyllo-inositol 2-dehydrogenase (NAD+)
MMKTRLKVGLIGLGRLGRLYAQFLSGRVGSIRLTAVADTDRAAAERVAEEFGVERRHYDAHELLADPEVDAVVITTPTSKHREFSIASLERGKPTFCEKPPALSLSECDEMKHAAARTGGFLNIGFMRRFDPAYAAGMARLKDGGIGDALLFKSTSRDPFPPSLEYADPKHSGGMIADMGIHDFDLAGWFMGSVESVHSTAGVICAKELATVGDFDNAVVTLRFASGALGVVDLSRTGIYGYDIATEILGSKGTLRMGYLRETAIDVMTKNSVAHDTVPYFMERFEKAYVAQLDDFGKKVLAGQPPSITIEDGISALQVSLAATKSAYENRTIRVNEVVAGIEVRGNSQKSQSAKS